MLRNKCKRIKTIYAKSLRNNMTTPEKILWRKLKCKNLGVKFRRQSIILGYIVDFYCPKLKLVIEIDGDSHLNKQQYDKTREEHMLVKNIKTIRFSNNMILNNLDVAIEEIIKVINLSVKNKCSRE